MLATKRNAKISCVFLDIGGVLITDGWDHHARLRAAKHFKLEMAEFERRHRMCFETYEVGALTLKEYLSHVVFYTPRSFTHTQFRQFMYEQSKPRHEMLRLASRLKTQCHLKVIVVSNEGRELNQYRIQKFKLNEFVDAFVSSCYVKMRKPDTNIFRLAIDVAQTPLNKIIYIDNTAMFVKIAEGLGIQGICHVDYKTTLQKLASLGVLAGHEVDDDQ